MQVSKNITQMEENMSTMKMDGPLFRSLVTNGAANLRINYKTVDALNVFPVPDGDTGTNLCFTVVVLKMPQDRFFLLEAFFILYMLFLIIVFQIYLFL